MIKRLIAMFECAVLAGMLVCVSPLVSQEPAEAQWQVPNYSVPIGRGAGTGFKSAAPGTAGYALTSKGASADPAFVASALNVRAFGAVGDCTTDDSTAIQSAITAAQNLAATNGSVLSGGGRVYFPAGCYRVATRLTSTTPIAFVGDGRLNSVIGVDNANGGISLTASNDSDAWLIEHLGFKALRTSAGTAIAHAGAVTASTNFPNLQVREVHIWQGGGSGFYFNKGITLSNCWHCVIEDSFIVGANASANWLNPAIEIGTKTIDGRINNTFIYGAATAVGITGSDAEGTRISKSSFVSVQNGVVADLVASAGPHISIEDSHMAVANRCLNIRGPAQVFVRGNLFYFGDTGGATTTNGDVCIFFENSNGTVVANNEITKQATAATSLTGTTYANSSIFTNSGNIYSGFDTGIWAQSTASNGVIDNNNRFFSVTTPVLNDAGTAISVVPSGPTGVTDNRVVRYDGTTGRSIKQSLVAIDDSGVLTGGTWNGVKISEVYGGTNQSTYTLGDTLYASAADTLSKLAGNTTAAKQYLSQTGNGTISAAPAWATIDGSDITGAALTKTDDSNVTLTLGGSPTTALLRATSITVGWTGDLPFSRFVQGATNTVVANATSGTADFTAFAMPSCSTAASSLIWTTNTGFGCNTSITAAAVPVGGITGLGTGVATWLATPSSANLASAITDETGSGALVFGTAPTFTTSITSPLVYGGSAAGSTLTLQDTSNGTPSGGSVIIRAAGQTILTAQVAGVGLDGTAFSSALTSVSFVLPTFGAVAWHYASNAASRNWKLSNDVFAFGDFGFFTGSVKDSFDTLAMYFNPSGGVCIRCNSDPGAGALQANTSLVSTTFTQVGTKIRAAGSAPAVSACGTTPTISGSDLAGLVTTGTGTPTSCTITFNVAYAAEPYCVVHGKTQAQVTAYTVSTTAIVVTTTATNNVALNYVCVARSAGWLLKRDLDPAANDNTPAFMENAA